MIKTCVGDITYAHTDVIVSIANGIGVMGRGVAGEIREAGGEEIQNEARRICKGKPKNAGECYVTVPGNLSANGVKYIYHAVTMKYPGGYTSLNIISKAVESIFAQLLLDEVDSIAMTALGTLEYSSVANIMVKHAKKYDNIFEICFIDKNESFIKEVNRILKQ